MIFFYALAAFNFIAQGAISGRLDGGGIAKTSQWFERSFVMFFFVLACAPFAGLWSLLAYLGVVGIATGHGQYLPSMVIKPNTPEKVDFIVRLFFKDDPRCVQTVDIHKAVEVYGVKKLARRCAFGMFITGTIVGLPAFALCLTFGKLYGAFFLLTGVVKSLSYISGWKLYKNTEPCEYINGGGRNVLCLCVILFSLSAMIK